MVLETVADFQDQSFGWQTQLELGRGHALWRAAPPLPVAF